MRQYCIALSNRYQSLIIEIKEPNKTSNEKYTTFVKSFDETAKHITLKPTIHQQEP